MSSSGFPGGVPQAILSALSFGTILIIRKTSAISRMTSLDQWRRGLRGLCTRKSLLIVRQFALDMLLSPPSPRRPKEAPSHPNFSSSCKCPSVLVEDHEQSCHAFCDLLMRQGW
jgi:hypothetical protein